MPQKLRITNGPLIPKIESAALITREEGRIALARELARMTERSRGKLRHISSHEFIEHINRDRVLIASVLGGMSVLGMIRHEPRADGYHEIGGVVGSDGAGDRLLRAMLTKIHHRERESALMVTKWDNVPMLRLAAKNGLFPIATSEAEVPDAMRLAARQCFVKDKSDRVPTDGRILLAEMTDADLVARADAMLTQKEVELADVDDETLVAIRATLARLRDRLRLVAARVPTAESDI